MDFVEWLDEQEKVKSWTDNKLAVRAGISPSVLTRARQGTIPKWDACMAIAQALELSPISVFRAAGLLPPGTSSQVTLDDWQSLLEQMSPADRDEMRQIAIMKIERKKEDQKLKNLKTKKAG